MSQASRYRLWCRPGLSVHPDGVVPQAVGGVGGAEDVGNVGDPVGPGDRRGWDPKSPFPLCNPLPLGFVDALQAHLEVHLGRVGAAAGDGAGNQDKRSTRWGWLFRRLMTKRDSLIDGLRKESARFLEARFPFLGEASSGTGLAVGALDRPPSSIARRPNRPPQTDEPWGNPLEGSLLSGHSEVQRHVLGILSGRRLLTQEVYQALNERGVSFFGSVDVLLDPLVHEGLVTRHPGVGVVRSPVGVTDEWQCRRCLSPNVGFYPCARCGLEACPQCDDCRSLGTSSACTVLYERPLGEHPLGEHPLGEPPLGERLLGLAASVEERPGVRVELPFSLSPFQQHASQQLVRSRVDVLVWAACGSGKTEVTLEAIAAVVREGGRALFAVPRRDVAQQLGRRLQDALVGVDTVTLTGGTPHSYDDAGVVVSTVHQAIRFHERFELVIVDEVDAFPLTREVWLLAALQRAKRPGGRLVLMTATPPERLMSRIGRGDLKCVTLPGRPHGHPLPVPEIVIEPRLVTERFQSDGEGEETPGWLTSLDALVRESLYRERRVLLFVPSVRLTSTLVDLFLKAGRYTLYRPPQVGKVQRAVKTSPAPTDEPSSSASASSITGLGKQNVRCFTLAAVHAQDGERTEKVAALEAGEVDFLISTSILERGVTLPRLDVIVFAADWERVYDAAALVQMAGRVGRSPKDPSGRVVFFARSTTPAMQEAIAAIHRFNEIAREQSSQF